MDNPRNGIHPQRGVIQTSATDSQPRVDGFSVRFLIDAQLPPALAAWFKRAGHDAVALRDVGLRDAVDEKICSFAVANGYVIVTKDEDYAALVHRVPGLRVLWIRIGNGVNRILLATFDAKWLEILEHLESDNPVVVLR